MEAGAGDHVLVVDMQAADRRCYLLPSFTTPPRSVQRWFEDRSDGALTAVTRKVIAVAEGRRTDSGTVEVVTKGTVA